MNDTFKGFLGGLVLAGILAAGTTCAHAQGAAAAVIMSHAPAVQRGTRLTGASDTQLVAQWRAAQTTCAGGEQIGEQAKTAACNAAEQISQTLDAHGWLYAHGAYYSPQQGDVVRAATVVVQAHAGTGANVYSLELETHAAINEEGCDDAAFIAWYNRLHDQIMNHPFGYAILSTIAGRIAASHPGEIQYQVGE